MPAAFGFPSPDAELWVPQVMAPAAPATPGEMRIELVPVIAKLKPGVSAASAEAAAETFLNNLRGTSEMAARMNEGITIHLTSLHEQLVAPVRPQLLVLTAAVGLVLLIACANVANLFLARARGRERDHAVRAALGAGRARLVTRLLLESAAFGLAGGALGAVVAYWGIRLLRFLQPPDLPLLEGAGLSVDVLLFNLGIALLTAMLVGLLPALRSSKVDLVTSLKGLGVGGTSSSGAPSRARNALAIAEVALALVLFVAAGLMLKSFSTLTSIDPGYEPADVLTFRLNLPESQYATGSDRRAVYDRLREEIGGMPGVRSVGVANVLPLDGARFITSIHVEGRPRPEDRMNAPRAEMRVVSPGFFRAMGVRLTAGTGFDEGDGPGTPGKVLINESLRARYFEDEDPIGKRLARMGEIVGVVADVRHEGFDSEPGPEVYLDYRQLPEPMAAMLLGNMSVAARVDPGQPGIADGLRSRLRAIDPELPLSDLRPMEARLADSVARPRLYAVLLALFALLALLLATSGVYSVVSYMVSQRTRETGVRLAFGASPSDIVRHVLSDGVRILGVGVGLGLAATLLLARYLRSVLYEVEPVDPVTIGAVALLLGACVLTASAIPARRAAKTDAMTALRYE